ncbi:MAG: thioredoxin family protein [Spirochaetia bacterium]|nr:thioredoxin family protein [Spirochaetia bacterium]MBO7431250.1 thioredoxin family protein [Spirochaetia bacterium]MBO7516403.1 thioredoxin family protein [Spirochaetia bacterium]MBP5740061.1 thioredoxin family protein [Spirochaetia bacterium]
MNIKVLGSSCCNKGENLLKAVKEALKNKGIEADVEYTTDMEKIVGYGAMSMPALVVNEKVVSVGKVLKAEEVEKLL